MLKQHTVEKIGGTSMSAYDAVRDNIVLYPLKGRPLDDENASELYDRIFVVSAYGGITDLLLEPKKSGRPGLFQLYSSDSSSGQWRDMLAVVRDAMYAKNSELFTSKGQLAEANVFIGARLDQAESCMADLKRLCRHGHFSMPDMLDSLREMLACIGEAHSAWNTAKLLGNEGVNATFVDLTGWYGDENYDLDELINKAFDGVDFSSTMPIVTGYARSKTGLMQIYDRGYSEMTFSRIAVLTEAREAIIHKEFHLSSADPRVVGEQNAVPIGRTNYEVADYLALLGMEAIHPKAAKGMRQANIPLRLRNTFEPEHYGTLIDGEYVSEQPQVEIIAGRSDVYALEFFDQDIAGELAQASEDLAFVLKKYEVDLLTKDYSANAVTLYLDGEEQQLILLAADIVHRYPEAGVSTQRVSIVSILGTDMKEPGMLSKAVSVLASNEISVLAVQQSMRQVSIQLVVAHDKYAQAVRALHSELVEIHDHGKAICLAC